MKRNVRITLFITGIIYATISWWGWFSIMLSDHNKEFPTIPPDHVFYAIMAGFMTVIMVILLVGIVSFIQWTFKGD